MNKKIAIYAGSFDPPTLGHEWVIQTASKMFDAVIVAVGVNPAKKTWFTELERTKMLKIITKDLGNIEVLTFFNQYLVDFASKNSANYIIRGIRNSADFEYESNLKLINDRINPNIETIYLMPPNNLREIASSNVKALYGIPGWQKVVKQFVSNPVLDKLQATEDYQSNYK